MLGHYNLATCNPYLDLMQWLVNALSLISPLKFVLYAVLTLLGAKNGQPAGMTSNIAPNAAAVTKTAPLKIEPQAKPNLSLKYWIQCPE
jgi:hypothetical protein